jgi:hypothetical protein
MEKEKGHYKILQKFGVLPDSSYEEKYSTSKKSRVCFESTVQFSLKFRLGHECNGEEFQPNSEVVVRGTERHFQASENFPGSKPCNGRFDPEKAEIIQCILVIQFIINGLISRSKSVLSV